MVSFDSPTQQFNHSVTGNLTHGLPISADEHRPTRQLSEESDVPLHSHRAARATRQNTDDGTALTHDRPRLRETIAEAPRKPHKKPGPKPYASKPVMKNDMEAKMEVIREIEELWGKNFIKAYVPKCHRPLIKKRKNGKRTVYRDHETDPKKWLPSVLKAILMIARLTDDKPWLKKAMADVVRYRIKNTGNRKPQLVTTDFDVIEDMLVRGWAVDESFKIRYKHLLMAQPKDDRQTSEDIEHILGASGSGSENGSDDSEAVDLASDDDAKMETFDDGEYEKLVDKRETSSEYVPRGGYVQNAPHCPPKKIVSREELGRSKSSSKKPEPVKKNQSRQPHQPPHPPMYGYGSFGPWPGYGPPMSGYGPHMQGFPSHMKGYPPPMYNYGSFGGYGQPPMPGGPRNSGRQGAAGFPGFPGHPGYPNQPGQGFPGTQSYNPYQPMGPPPSAADDGTRSNRFSPFGGSKSGGGLPTQDENPAGNTYGRSTDREMQSQSVDPQLQRTRIKRESGGEERPISIDDFDGPTNYLGDEQSEEPDADMEEAMRLQLEEAEAEHKLIQLRRKLAQAKKR